MLGAGLLLAVAVAVPAAPVESASPAVRPAIAGVSHIAFRVSDLARARAFYAGLLGYEEAAAPAATGPERVRFEVSDRQFIEIVAGLAADRDDRLDHVAFETADVAALRAYLEGKGVKSAEPRAEGGDRILRVSDPDGHAVEFVQHVPGARGAAPASASSAAPLSRRVSARILHVGLTVADVAAADRFYKDTLGFSEIWRGGRTDAATDWINMKVPDGTDYLEYMLVSGPVDRERLGTLHHVALVVPDIQAALETLRARPGGLDARTVRTPQVGRNNRWQLNLYDPDGSRAELMEPFTMR